MKDLKTSYLKYPSGDLRISNRSPDLLKNRTYPNQLVLVYYFLISTQISPCLRFGFHVKLLVPSGI